MVTRSLARSLLGAAIFGAATAALAAERLTVLSEGGAAAHWRPVAETIAVPAYPGILADKSEDVCIGVGYMLKADGSTSEFALLTAWGSKAGKAKADDPRFTPFAQNSLAAVQRWKFTSTAAAGTKINPIYTAATFAFSSNPAADVGQLKAHCVIADLSDFIADAQAEAYRRRGNLDKGRMDRARQTPAEIPLKSMP
jgi:hypothetical protein